MGDSWGPGCPTPNMWEFFKEEEFMMSADWGRIPAGAHNPILDLLEMFVTVWESICTCAYIHNDGALWWTICIMLISYTIYNKLGISVNECIPDTANITIQLKHMVFKTLMNLWLETKCCQIQTIYVQ